MNWLLPLLVWLHIGITTSMARKHSNRNGGDQRNNKREEEIIFEPNASSEDFKHIKIPIIEADDDDRAAQDDADYPKVYEENQDDPNPPESEEFRAPSREYEAPEYTPPKSEEIFDDDTYQQIVKSVTIPTIRFSGSEKDSDTPIEQDLQIQDDTPEIPPELVDIKIPTSIPKPNVKIPKPYVKIKHKKKKKPSIPKRDKIKKVRKTKKPKKVQQSKRTKDPDQVKEYSQMIDNSNPKEEVLIINPVKKKRPNPVFFSNEFKPEFHFPTQTRPPTRVPIRFYPSPKLKRKPKRINVIIQNKKRKPLLITHQNGDVIYWYPSKQPAPKNKKLQCKRTGFSNQCMIIAHKRPVVSVPRMPKMSSYTFMRGTKPPPNYFDNSDKESLYYQVVKNPKKVSPEGLFKFSQFLFHDDNQETGSFFKEIDDQDNEGIDEPEAENHEDERITDEEVENDKEKTDDDEEEEEQEEGDGNGEEQDEVSAREP